MRPSIKILLIFFSMILAFIAVVILIFKLPTTLLKIRYNSVVKNKNSSSCYSGWVSKDFNQTYTSAAGFSFMYPKYLHFKSDPNKFEDARTQFIEEREGALNSNNGFFIPPNIHIDIR